MAGRRRTILITCSDGPLKGQSYASHLAQGDRLIVQGRLPGRDDLVQVHEYLRTSPTTAIWVRHIEDKPFSGLR